MQLWSKLFGEAFEEREQHKPLLVVLNAADARAPVPTTAVSITLRFLRKSIACVAGRLI